jgi:hypothetical protein
MVPVSPIFLSQLAHSVSVMAVVGAQILMTVLVWIPLPPGHADSAVWRRVEDGYRTFLTIGLLLILATGLLRVRYTLVSLALLQTPYGTILYAKLAIGVLLTMMIMVGPRAHGRPDGSSSTGARVLAILRTLLVLIGVVLASRMPYA